MYESHFGLNKKAFQITTDPSFLWMGDKHREALDTLKYGVMENKGFLLLTGEVGTGKTTLINRLVEDIKVKAYSAKISDPRLSKYDFYRMVNRFFKLPTEVRTKNDFLEPFTRFLKDTYKERKSVLLLIDEAQRLKFDLMEEIRLLSNLEYQDTKLLNIFFVGQSEFNRILLQPENRALMRRITITYNLDPLNQAETGAYIRHRLKVAGTGQPIFSKEAVAEIYDFSNGFPRQINIICDLAMFFAAQLNLRTIGQKIIRQCRERISFSVDETPPDRPAGVGAPVTAFPPSARRSLRRRLRPLRVVMILILASMALGVGAHFAPDAWKDRFHQWLHQLHLADDRAPDVSSDHSEAANHHD
jgi:general secretion pathway protein A